MWARTAPGQHKAFDVSACDHHRSRRVTVVYRRDILGNDRTIVEVGRHVAGRAAGGSFVSTITTVVHVSTNYVIYDLT